MSLYTPPILLTLDDRAALSQLVTRSEANAGVTLLDREVRRATVVPARRLPPDAVRLNSTVTFLDNEKLEIGSTQVVLPDLVSAPDQTSVTSPLGAALIGLRVGQTIRWRDKREAYRVVTVTRVTAPRTHEV